MKTFNYTPSSPLTGRLTNLGIALGMILIPIFVPFGIRIGTLRILGPTGVAVLFIGGGLVLLTMTLLEIRKARVLAAQGAAITVDGTRVTYPEVEKGSVQMRTFDLSEIEWTKFDDEENELTVRLTDRSVVFDASYFDDEAAYDAFEALLKK